MIEINVTIKLPPYVRRRVDKGVKNAAVEWGVNLPTSFSFNFKPKEGVLTGNCPLKPLTKVSYYGHYQQFWRFCAWTGNYASMLIFLHPAISKFPAVKLETLDLFV